VKIIEPSFSFQLTGELLTEDKGIHLLRWVESNARISHRSEDLQTDDSWKRFIQAVVIGRGDWSVTEHAALTAIIRTDRGVTHELVRHRLFSFTQESTRFVNYQKKGGELEFIRPIELRDKGKDWYFLDSLHLAEKNYLDMIGDGVRPQEARSVLPNALAATISMTGNLRNWRHFFLMRTSKETHPDMRRITIPMLGEIQRCVPLLYADIVPEERQIENLKKAR
jgi:thymidylate synthase (FAD)